MSKASSDQKQGKFTKEHIADYSQRLQMLENNLSRVCLQQDALMPLLSMIEHIPQIQRMESMMKNMQKKQEDLEISLKEKSRDTSTNTSFSEFKHAVKNSNKPIEKQINDLTHKMQNLDVQYQQIVEHQKIGQNDKENYMTMQSQNQDTDIHKYIKEELGNMKHDMQSEFKNLYKEINGLKCDVEYIMNNTKKTKITQKMQQMNINPDDKLLVINLLEQDTFIDDLDHYENENGFRFLYEIDYIEHQREQLQNMDVQQQMREQIYLDDKIISLKYQLAASKRKYLMEIKKIEHKFQILGELAINKHNYQNQIMQLNQRMVKLVGRLHQNIEQVFIKINALDTK